MRVVNTNSPTASAPGAKADALEHLTVLQHQISFFHNFLLPFARISSILLYSMTL